MNLKIYPSAKKRFEELAREADALAYAIGVAKNSMEEEEFDKFGVAMEVMEINTHEKLMNAVFESSVNKVALLRVLQLSGYEGTEDQMVRILLLGIGRSDAFIDSAQSVVDSEIMISAAEYFQMLAKEMNKCI